HCRDPHSDQRLYGVNELPERIGVRSVHDDGDTVELEFDPDGHRSTFSWEWLAGSAHRDPDPRGEGAKLLWPTGHPRPDAVTGGGDRLRDDPAHRAHCLRALLRRGFVLLRGVPAGPGTVLEVAAELGFVRETNYGRLFDVRVEPAAANLAFTARPIPPHTD